MLRRVLQEIEEARGPLSLSDLAQRLQVDQGTLEGMIAFWVRKGRIDPGHVEGQSCATGACGGCAGASACPFAGPAPRTFMLT